MKTYRSCVVDAYAVQDCLDFLSHRADTFAEDADCYRAQLAEDTESDGSYYRDCIAESEARAAAFERLISKVSK